MQYKEVHKGFRNSAEVGRASAKYTPLATIAFWVQCTRRGPRVRSGFDCNDLFIWSILNSLLFIMLAALN